MHKLHTVLQPVLSCAYMPHLIVWPKMYTTHDTGWKDPCEILRSFVQVHCTRKVHSTNLSISDAPKANKPTLQIQIYCLEEMLHAQLLPPIFGLKAVPVVESRLQILFEKRLDTYGNFGRHHSS